MKQRFNRWWITPLCLMLLASWALAGTTGKISGVVTDKETGQPIPGAAITIEGTTLGALSNESGEFVLLNIPVGTYTLKGSLVGYSAMAVQNVSVSVDLTTYQDFQLSARNVEMGTITVVSERPLVLRDQTASLRIVTEQEVQNMPTRGYQDVVSLQAGVVAYRDNSDSRQRGFRENTNTATMSIRGGRRSEVAYFVDGFSQQDPVTGLSTTQINQNSIQEIAVTTGGFNAEYGWISSGAINVTTKEGQSKYSGNIDLVTDNIGSKSYDYNIYALDLTGPLWPGWEKGTLFISAGRRWQRDRSPHSTVQDLLGDRRLPQNSLAGYSWQGKFTVNLTKDLKWRTGILGSYDDWREYQHDYLFNKEHMPRYKDKNNSFFTQLVHSVSSKTFYTLSANYFATERERGDGVYFNNILEYARPVSNPQFFTGDLFWKYDDMYPSRFDSTYRQMEGGDSVLVVDTVQTKPSDPKGLYVHTNVDSVLVRAIIDSTTNPRVHAYSDVPDIGLTPFMAIDPILNAAGDSIGTDTTWGRGFMAVGSGDEGHVWEDYLHRKSSYAGLKFDLTSQLQRHHEVKFGMEFQRHTLRYYQSYFPHQVHGYFTVDTVRNDATGQWDTLVTNNGFKDVNHYGFDLFNRESDTLSEGSKARHPVTFATYLQDKFEWEGLVLNAGLRFDYFNANTDRLKDANAPLAYGSPNKLDDADFEKTKAEMRLSPRVGVGFPISDKANFHISYGKFFQRPDLENLYMSRDYLARMLEETPYFNLLANPNLAPEKTTAYEVGYTQQLGDFTRLDITAYHKDVEDLTVAATQNAFIAQSATSFGTFRNADYGTIRGLELGIKMRRNHNIQLDCSYTLEYAKGTGSFPQTQYNIVWQNMASPRHSNPLDYDQRHKVSANMDIRSGPHEGFKVGDFYPFENAGVNFVLMAGSGTAYTSVIPWNEVSSAALAPDPRSSINAEHKPWTYRVDLKANRTFTLGKVHWDVYLWVMNVFDRKNVVDVYESTGRPNTTSWLNTQEGQTFIRNNGDPTEHSGMSGEELYRLREQTPLNYDAPRQIRFGVKVNF
ncbi:MAG: TonB-dependent receptor [candidate division Zixibacteria bacterium]|nr:TonB-dependent receptor [candidate division Zixibacteria bacterium]